MAHGDDAGFDPFKPCLSIQADRIASMREIDTLGGVGVHGSASGRQSRSAVV